MDDCPLTDFAPAERSPREEIARQRACFDQELFFNEVLSYIPIPVMILNLNRQIVFANKAVLDLTESPDLNTILGLRPGELIKCKHSHDGPGGCGTTHFCRYCALLFRVQLLLEASKDSISEFIFL